MNEPSDMASAPALSEAIALIVMRHESMMEPSSTSEYVHLLREMNAEMDPIVLLSAVTSMAAIFATGQAAAVGLEFSDYMNKVGMVFAQQSL